LLEADVANGSITLRAVEALKPGEKPRFLWDHEVKGFGLKVTPSGTRTYIFQYRLGGRGAKTKRYTIGTHGRMTPDEARKRAKRLAAQVLDGADPSAIRRTERQERVDLAFDAYVSRFLELQMEHRAPRFRELTSAILRVHVTPRLRDKALPAITKGDVVHVLDGLPAGQIALRRNTFAILRLLFNWAVNRGDIAQSPIANMTAPAAVAARDRVLTDPELALVWQGAGQLGYPFGPFVRLLVATGQRRDEATKLDWSELDRESATWSIPSERTKNGKPHLVPLNALAVATLGEVAALRTKSAETWPKQGLVFTTTGKSGISGYSRAKSRLDEIIADLAQSAEAEPPKPWRLHDLRRTLATGMQRLGVRFEVTEAILNHLSGSRSGVAAVYQRHDWAAEKRVALHAWADHIERRLAPQPVDNVIPMARASRD
jgi:integrase